MAFGGNSSETLSSPLEVCDNYLQEESLPRGFGANNCGQ